MQNNVSFPLLKENLRRFWPIMALAFAGYFYSTAVTIMTKYDFPEQAALNIYHAIYANSGLTLLVDLLLPIAAAWAVMSFTYQKGSFDMIHALPFTRNGLFITSALSGLVLIILPLLLNGIVLMVISRELPASSLSDWVLARQWFETDQNLLSAAMICQWMGKQLFTMVYTYVIALLAGCLAGNLPFHGLLAVGLNFALPVVHGVVLYYCKYYLFGFTQMNYGFLSPLWTATPWLQLVNESSRHGFFLFGINAHTLSRFGEPNLPSYIMYTALLLLVLAAAYLAFQKRHPEKSGEPLAVSILELPMCVLVSLAAMTLLPILLTDEYGNPAVQAVWALLGFIVCQLLMKRSLQIFTVETLKRLAVSAAACALFVAIFALDVTGYESRIMDLDKDGSTINLFANFNHGYTYNSRIRIHFNKETSDLTAETYSALTGFHKSVVDNKQTLTDSDNSNLTMDLEIHLAAANGRDFIRVYTLPYEFIAQSPELAALFESDQYKEQILLSYQRGDGLPVLDAEDIHSVTVEGNFIPGWAKEKDTAAIAELKQAVMDDVQNRTYKEAVKLQEYYGSVTFRYTGIHLETGDSVPGQFWFQLDGSMPRTMAWIEEHGYSYLFPTAFASPLYAIVEHYDFNDPEERFLVDLAGSYGLGQSSSHYYGDARLDNDKYDAGLPEEIFSSVPFSYATADVQELAHLLDAGEVLPADFEHFYRIAFIYKVDEQVASLGRISSTALAYRYVRPDDISAAIANKF